jgi:hypothetical protein
MTESDESVIPNSHPLAAGLRGGYIKPATIPAPANGSVYTREEVKAIGGPLLDNLKSKQLVDYPIHDAVNHPSHYVSHPSGIECIQITEHMGFNLGNALKYIWRADLKHNAIEDLRKAVWYIERELSLREQKTTDKKES